MNTDTSTQIVEISNSHPGALFASVPERTLRGLLVKWKELSRPSVSGEAPVYFERGDIEIPEDFSVLGVNVGHSQFSPIARFESIEETDEGLVTTYRVAKGQDGDALLSAVASGELNALSAEFPRVTRDPSNPNRGIHARLSGAAFVPVGAMPSAALFSIEPDDKTPYGIPADAWAVIQKHLAQAKELTAAAYDAASELANQTTEGAPASEDTTSANPGEDSTEKESEADEVTTSIVPDDAPGATTPVANDNERALFAAVANRSTNPDALAPFRNAGALFAINNIQESGPSGRTIYADTAVPAAVGELWTRQAYALRYLPLITQASLTATTVRGWRWVTGPEVADYTGNLAEVPSNVVDTEPVTTDALRLGGGHKLDRKFYDFNDQSVIESYFRLQTEDVARKLDAKALAAITSAATTTAPGSVPSGVAKGLAAIVDGALGIIGTENRPAFAIVSPELWRDIALTKSDDKLEFLNAGFGLTEGDFASFKIVPGNVGTGKVIVGAKEAVTFYTLPGQPIRVEGLDVHHGGVDVAVFAYYASIANNAAAIRSVTVA